MAHKQSMQGEPDLFGGIPIAAVVEMSASKADEAFKTISETAEMLALPQHVLRFWESKFAQVKPLKLRGGRRYYRPQDIETLAAIKHLLYKEGYTIKGARRAFAQSKKRKVQKSSLTEPMPRKPKKERIAEAPLFDSLVPEPTPQANIAGKKAALKQIHNELLELRELIASLPSLTLA